MGQKYTVDIEVKSAEAEKQVENLNKDLKETKEDLSGINEAGDKMTGGLVSGFQSGLKSVKSFAKGLRTVNGLLKASLFGAIALAITSVATALTNSEEGQNKFAKWLNQITVVIGNVTDILGNFGNAILSLITLNFDEAAESIAKVTEGIKNFGEETRKEIAIAGELSDMRAKADKAERDLQVQRAKADRTRADLLEKAVNKEKFTVEERIGFLEEAGRLEEEITNKEIKAAQLRLEARQLENSLSASTKEDLDEEARLKAELIQLETAKLTKQKEVTSQTIALKAEEAAALKAIEDEKKAEEDKKKDADDKALADKLAGEKALADLKKQIRDAEAVTEEERRALEIEKVTEHYNNLITLAKANNIDITALEEAKTKRIDELNKTEVTIAKLTGKQKVQIALDTLNLIGMIAGEGSKIGKAAAIAQATISTIEGTINTFKTASNNPITTFFPPYPFIQAGIAAAAGITNINKIKSVKVGSSIASGSIASVGTSGTGAAAIPSTPPQFNVVGTSGANQLAGAIAGQQQQPVKAFVVSNDVTTAQELDRNIVSGATIG